MGGPLSTTLDTPAQDDDRIFYQLKRRLCSLPLLSTHASARRSGESPTPGRFKLRLGPPYADISAHRGISGPCTTNGRQRESDWTSSAAAGALFSSFPACQRQTLRRRMALGCRLTRPSRLERRSEFSSLNESGVRRGGRTAGTGLATCRVSGAPKWEDLSLRSGMRSKFPIFFSRLDGN